jgi:drug/metabolite transporter (DMT)-like permease
MPPANLIFGRTAAMSAPVQGALLMTLAALGFSIMNILIRFAAEELHPFQIAFFRNLFALIFILPWLVRHGLTGLKTKRIGLHLWRSLVGLAAMLCWFTSITILPLAEAVALNFTVPLFATAGAFFILGEVVGIRRWSATLAGFAGVLVILQPGFIELTPAMAMPVIAAVFMAGSVLLVKTLSHTEDTIAMVLYMNLILTPLSLLPALFVWQWPSWPVVGYLLLIGFVASLAHLALTKSYSMADASAVIPFDYTRLPFVALIAYFAFDELPGLSTWIGAGIIAASAIYIARREAKVTRERTAAEAARALT